MVFSSHKDSVPNFQSKNTPAKRLANSKYDRHNTRVISLKFNKNTDSDILAFLDSLDNVQGTLKCLIRCEIERVNK